MLYKRSLLIGMIVVSSWSALDAAGQTPLGTSITFQGQLTENGQPANAEYDFQFRLYDAASGGNPISQPLPADDVPVENGMFSRELDFVPMPNKTLFDGDNRWINVAVRPGNSNGLYTLLTPRQKLTAAPYAVYALGGPGGDGLWAASGNDIHNTNDGRVGIGTSTPTQSLHLKASIPVIAVQDGDDSGIRHSGYVGFNDSGNVQRGWMGFGSQSDSDFSLMNRYETGNTVLGTQGTPRLVVTATGKVGVGTDSPGAKLHVIEPDDGIAGYFLSSTGGTAILAQALGDQGATVWATAQGAADAVYGFTNGTGDGGNFEIFNSGSTASAVSGKTNGRGRAGRFEIDNPANTTSGLFSVHNGSGNAIAGVNTGTGRGGYFESRSSATGLYCVNTTGGLAFHANGTARVDVLEITGADIAERFPVDETECAEPGTVMEIDPTEPGRLRVASCAYSRSVAGVVSGANDLSVGAVLGNLPGNEDAPPIALSGRVWVRCDASYGAIEPGDRLTTSKTAGHAMKAADRGRADGATIGKAMSSLNEGKGMVLVLVSLQ
ncbi:MAG: hypothetical protein C4547_15350 [Phycisphaerales bacterium]|nr:MAG: hypothetical protein C4547_15350 [Phycisphaerales bacterium]